MKTTVRTIAPDRPLAEAAEIMKRFGIEHLVVVQHGTPVGLLSDGDILRHAADGDVASAMTRRLVTVGAEELVTHAANRMRGHGIKSLVVMRAGKLAGIITSTDVLEIVSRTGHKERMTLPNRGPRRKQTPAARR